MDEEILTQTEPELPGTPEPPRRPSGFMRFLLRGIGFILQLVLVAAVGYVSFEWLMRSMVHSRKEVPVPELQGQTTHRAAQNLSKLHLALSLETEEYAPNAPVGTVIKQYPVAGSLVREGKIISVVTSIGSQKISVPELTGMPLRRAEIEIKASQLALGEMSETYSLLQPKGYVVAQEPNALGLAEKGDLVHLTISLGEPPANKLIIPDFTGGPLEKASSWAKQNGIPLHTADDWSASGHPDGTVIKQNLTPDAVFNRSQAEESGLKLEVAVARNALKSQADRFMEYKIPERPSRKREVVLKVLGSGGEREAFRSMAQPGETIKIPLEKETRGLRARIYLDGVFTEERRTE